MKIDFSQIVSMSGRPVLLEDGVAATLGALCREALNTPHSERRLGLDEMVARGKLAIMVAAGGEVEVRPEDAALIRKCLPDRFQHSELVVTLYGLLDPKAPVDA